MQESQEFRGMCGVFQLGTAITSNELKLAEVILTAWFGILS